MLASTIIGKFVKSEEQTKIEIQNLHLEIMEMFDLCKSIARRRYINSSKLSKIKHELTTNILKTSDDPSGEWSRTWYQQNVEASCMRHGTILLDKFTLTFLCLGLSS